MKSNGAALRADRITERPQTACPFYGFHAEPHLRILVDQQGNQCALILTAYSPCWMEMEGHGPDWVRCPRADAGTDTAKLAEQIRLQSWKVHNWKL